MSSIFRTMFRKFIDSQDIVVNNEEINYPKIQSELDEWKLPKVFNQEIYKKWTFKFFIDYTIRTLEQSVSLEQDDQVIRLLDGKSVERHKRDYNFIHFGMIQVVTKPLTRLGLNTSIIMSLRDKRHLDYWDSIIGTFQARLNDGPVYFQCFPNFTVRLRDFRLSFMLRPMDLSLRKETILLPSSLDLPIRVWLQALDLEHRVPVPRVRLLSFTRIC